MYVHICYLESLPLCFILLILGPQELRLHKKRLAKFRFKSLVRKVLANRVWLSEIEETQLGDNVRRNVAIIVRRKGVKGILTLEEKTLLNTRMEYRTDDQKRRIVSIVASLACMVNLPPVSDLYFYV